VARTPEGRRLTEAHKQAQIRLGALAAALTVRNAERLDPDNLDATEARWKAGQAAIIATLRRRSQLLAEEYLRAFWAAEGIPPADVATPDLPPIADAVDWVVPTIKARTARYG
jgi:hypothetical protein